MDNKLLEDIGLTEAETRVYLSLVELGSTKTGPLSIKSKVSYSKIYKVLYRLEQKGLVGHVIKGKVKHFKAMNPKTILKYVDEKAKKLEKQKKDIENLLPELESKIPSDNVPESITYFGFKSIKNLLFNILGELNRNDIYYTIGATHDKDVYGVRPFFELFHRERVKKKIKVKMLGSYLSRGNLKSVHYKNSEIRFLPEYLLTNMHILFYKDVVIIVLWTKDPIAFNIKSKDAVESFKKYFDAFWKIADK